MDKLIVYPDGTNEPSVEFEIANGFVQRCVSSIAEMNIPDAERVARILNRLEDPATAAIEIELREWLRAGTLKQDAYSLVQRAARLIAELNQ